MSELSRSSGEDIYIPTSTEKKRVVSALFFMGIIMMLAKSESLSNYERYYLSFALSMRTIVIALIFVMILVFFVARFLGYFLVVVLLGWVGLLIYAIQQSWMGVYNHTSPLIRIFVGLGEWLLTLFSEDADSFTTLDDLELEDEDTDMSDVE